MKFNLLSENKLKISLSSEEMISIGISSDTATGVLGDDVIRRTPFRNLLQTVSQKTDFDISSEFEVSVYASSFGGVDMYLTKPDSVNMCCDTYDYSKKTYLFSFSKFSHLLGACKYIASLESSVDSSVYYESTNSYHRYFLLFSQSIYEVCGDICPACVIGEFADSEIKYKPSVTAYIIERCTPLIEKDAARKLAEFY